MNNQNSKLLVEAMSVNARIEAMKAANARRDMPVESEAYDESHFFEAEKELSLIAQQMDYHE